jgi:hypothetical protein
MAIDLTQLTQAQLLQIVNATPQGTVLTRSRLRRQMDAGAYRFGDGTHIHLARYVRWLVREMDRPRAPKTDYVAAKRRQAQRNRAATKAAQDIFPIPEVVDRDRRRAAGESFRLFCTTYFPGAFWRPWSQDHLRVIEKIEKAVREGGLFAFAMPRGSGKTALARCAALWAILYGYRPFVCMISGSQDNARELLRPIRTFILEEPLLLEDFPEAVYPLRSLENSSKRQLQQHIAGKLTHVHWGQDKIVFPSIEGEHLPTALREDGMEVSPSAGSIIATTSLDSNLRGQQHTRPDRTIIRPSLVLLDDPQTRESAMSADQTRKRLNLVHGDVMGLAGPGESISALLTCTVMYEGDLADTLLDREKSPEAAGLRGPGAADGLGPPGRPEAGRAAAARAEQLVWQLAGIVGVEPGPLTLRELALMADGRQRAAWGHTSSVLAMLANVNRDPKKSRRFRPSDFDPYSSSSLTGVRVRSRQNRSASMATSRPTLLRYLKQSATVLAGL